MKKTTVKTTTILLFAMLALTGAALAAGTSMPWEGTLESTANSISGPVVKWLSVIAVAIFGLITAFGEGGSAMTKGAKILFGLSIACAGTSWILSFFGFGGGVLF